MIIAKVWVAKKSGTKFITIPKNSDLDSGDYVKIVKLKDVDDVIVDVEASMFE